MRLRLWWVVVSLGVLSAGAAIATSDSAPEADEANANARARAQLAREALEIMDRRIETGSMSKDDPERIRWSRRLVDALADVQGDRTSHLKALRDHAALLKEVEDMKRERHRQSQITILDVKDATYDRLEAEALLDKAQGR